MFKKLIVLACVVALCLGGTLPASRKFRPRFSKSGKPILGQRIVGGRPIDITEAPYQVALEEGGYLTCGGSIVNENQIVCAAHCVQGATPTDLSIRAGSSELESGGTVINVKSLEYNENYSYFTIDYDVSILTLERPLTFGQTIQPIALTSSEPQAGDIATVSGWGALEEGDWFLPDQLHAVDVPIVSRAECRDAYGESDITDRMICAAVPEGGKDSCQGDSGGPLVVGGTLAGIVSWGSGCARVGYPGVYTNVDAVRDWIEARLISKK